MSLALRTADLTKVYYKKEGFLKLRATPTTVVDKLNLQVPQGEVYGFLGMNGAGKTTTIKTLMGFIEATSGGIEVFGERIGPPEVRRRIGFAPERAAFYDYLTAREVLEYLGGLSRLPAKIVSERVPHLLELVALDGKGDTLVKNFSKGMQTRLGIAQSLLGDPDLLVFDEPTTGLDPLGRRMFKDLVLKLSTSGKTVFFSSHQLSDVQEICKRVGIIHRGKLLYEGLVADLVKDGTALEEKFVKMVTQVDHEMGIKTQIQ